MKILNSSHTIFWLALFVLITLFSSHSYAGKNVETFPEELQGLWALTSCGDTSHMKVNTKYFHMRIEQNKLGALEPVIHVEKQEDFYFIKIGGYKTAFHIPKTGILYQNIFPDEVIIGNAPASDWAQLDPDNNLSYIKCPKDTEKHLDPELAYILGMADVLDKFQDSCPMLGSEQNIACHELFFDTFDQDKNKQLDDKELVRLNHTVSYIFTNIFESDDSISEFDHKKHDTETLIKNITDIFDHNGSDTIDMEEVRKNWNNFSESQDGRNFIEKINALHQIIAIDSPYRPNKESGCDPQQILENSISVNSEAEAGNACSLPADGASFK